MPIESCLLFGAGGHAKVVLEALRTVWPGLRIEVRDDDPVKADLRLLGCSVQVPCLPGRVDDVAVHVAIGDNIIRRRMALAAQEAGAKLTTIVHPSSTCSPSATIGEGVFVAAQAVLGPDSMIADGGIVNHGAIVDHDCQVGAWTHVAPGVVLGGAVRVGEGVLLGSGCVVLPGISIGDWATVGAGAVVTRDVAAHTTVVGVPAR